MATKQTRRSISVSGESYQKLKVYCSSHDCSMSGVVEDFLRSFLAIPDKKAETEISSLDREERLRKIREITSAKSSFTF